MAISQQRMTLEQFLELPEEEPALEFFDGMVTQKMSPKGRHSALQHGVASVANQLGMPQKLFRAFPELRTTFGGRSTVPDVAIYRWERVPLGTLGGVADDFTIPPDVVVEIVSPRQSVNSLVRRCLWYVANGVRIALLVDPDDRSVLLFRAGVEPLILHDSDQIDLTDALPTFRLTVDELFSSLDHE